MSTMEKVVKTITKPFTVKKSNETMKTSERREITKRSTDLQETKIPLAEKEYMVSVLNTQTLQGTDSHLVETVNINHVSMQNCVMRELLINTVLSSK